MTDESCTPCNANIGHVSRRYWSTSAGKLSSLADTIIAFSESLTAASLHRLDASPVDDTGDPFRCAGMSDVTQILQQIEDGDPSAMEQLLPLVYGELRKLAAARMAAESPDHTLQATALVHEAYLRLVDGGASYNYRNRRHFFATAATAMRQILVDRARRKRRIRHGGDVNRIALDEVPIESPADAVSILALDEALSRFVEEQPEFAEVVQLRYFAGLTLDEIADLLGVSVETVQRRWRFSRAWLHRAIEGQQGTGDA